MVTYGDTDGSGMDGGQWSPAQCPPPTGHPPLCSALTVIIIVCIAEKFLNKKRSGQNSKGHSPICHAGGQLTAAVAPFINTTIQIEVDSIETQASLSCFGYALPRLRES